MSAPGKVEKGLAIVVLLLSTGAFLNLFLKHGKFTFESQAGLPFMQLVWSSFVLDRTGFLVERGPRVRGSSRSRLAFLVVAGHLPSFDHLVRGQGTDRQAECGASCNDVYRLLFGAPLSLQ